MKTADILALLDDVGIGIDHPDGAEDYCAYWPKEPGKGGIVIQAKPDELIKAVIQSFQAVYLAHSKRSKELSDFKALVKQISSKKHRIQKIRRSWLTSETQNEVIILERELTDLETQVDKYLQE
jgi:hypothetical protein